MAAKKKAPKRAPKKTAPKLSKHDAKMAKLRAPSRWPSYGAWLLAMERTYGKHHTDWPVWGLEAMALHVAKDLRAVS